MSDIASIRPFGARVTVTDPPDIEEPTKRIILPDGVRADLTQGIVVEVGERLDQWHQAGFPKLDPGDTIWFSHICNQLGDLKIIEATCIVCYAKFGEDGGGHREDALAS